MKKRLSIRGLLFSAVLSIPGLAMMPSAANAQQCLTNNSEGTNNGYFYSFWKDSERVAYHSVTDSEALAAFEQVARHEGIIAALESSHAFAWAARHHKDFSEEKPKAKQ